jgi:hypothetical protein
MAWFFRFRRLKPNLRFPGTTFFLWFATRLGLGGSSSIIFFVHGSVIRQYWKWTKFLNFIALSNKPWTSDYSFSVDFIDFNYKNEMDFNFLAATIVFFYP